jgi:peptidylprolyl isomerase
MIAGFDAGVVGMKIAESKVMTLAPEEAYGVHDESKTQTIPKKDLVSFIAAGVVLEVGEKLPTQYGEFEIIEVTE